MSIKYAITPPVRCQNKQDWEREAGIALKVQNSEPQIKEPPLYKVIILNDDYTSMDFVVEVLERFFNLGYEQA